MIQLDLEALLQSCVVAALSAVTWEMRKLHFSSMPNEAVIIRAVTPLQKAVSLLLSEERVSHVMDLPYQQDGYKC